MTVRRAPIAIVDPTRQIQVLDVHDRLLPQTAGGDPSLVWGWWNPERREQVEHAWPTWSPCGRRIACFATTGSGGSQVVALDVGGVHSTAVADLAGMLPIYLYWSPAGDRIGILSQRVGAGGDRLVLTVASADDPDAARPLAEGSPLFFTWAGDRLAAFVGDPDGAESRLALLGGPGPEAALKGRPGNFCAPVFVADGVVFVIQNGATATVVRASLDPNEVPTVLETLRGLVALVASPDGRRIARAVAPGGDGSAYRDLAVIDIASGRVTPVADEPCLAFVWAADGGALLTAQVDTARNLIAWRRVDLSGRSRALVDMYPTRDFGFYLRFFEQYAQSHPLVAPGGDALLIAGGVDGYGDPHRGAGIWEVDTTDGGATKIADGVFATWGPPFTPAGVDPAS